MESSATSQAKLSSPEAVAIASVVDPLLASDDFLRLIPRDFAQDHGVLSQGMVSDDLQREIIAVSPATSAAAIWNIGVRLGRSISTQVSTAESIHAAIDSAYERYASHAPAKEQTLLMEEKLSDSEDVDQLLAEADRDLLATEGKAPLVKVLDRLLFAAVQRGASDLHIQPTADRVLIRLRVDGVLDQGHPVPASVYRPLVGRIKVLGRMDVA
jgi:general secretion pathway protein E